jgi:hypothetical protein
MVIAIQRFCNLLLAFEPYHARCQNRENSQESFEAGTQQGQFREAEKLINQAIPIRTIDRHHSDLYQHRHRNSRPVWIQGGCTRRDRCFLREFGGWLQSKLVDSLPLANYPLINCCSSDFFNASSATLLARPASACSGGRGVGLSLGS